MANKLTAEEIGAVAKTIELIEYMAYDDEKRLAEMVRSWLKGEAVTALDNYWVNYEACLDKIAAGVTAEQLIATCNEHFARSTGDAFFPGGGDRDMAGTLLEAGWSMVWCQADYYFAARDHEGKTITYVEGDIYRGTQRPLP